MDKLKKRKDMINLVNTRKFLLVVKSVFCTMALIVDTSVVVNRSIELSRTVTVNFTTSMFVFLSVYFILGWIEKKDISVIPKRYTVVPAAFFSIIMILGNNMNMVDHFFPNYLLGDISKYNFLIMLCCFIGWFVLCSYLILCVFFFLEGMEVDNSNGICRTISLKQLFVVIEFFQILWFFFFWPGFEIVDGYYQIAMAMGWTKLADNPLYSTLLIRAFFKPICALTGNIMFAFGVFRFVTVTFFSLIVAYAIHTYQRSYQYNEKVFKIIFLLYIMNPAIYWFNNLVGKDNLLAYSVLFLCVEIYRLFSYSGGPTCYVGRIKNIVLLLLACIFTLFSKGTGIISVITAVMAVLVFVREKKSLMISLTVIMSSIAIYKAGIWIAVNNFGVEPYGTIGQTVIWQTLARTVRDNEEKLSDEEIEQLSIIMDIEEVSDKYTVRWINSIYDYLNFDEFNENKERYMRLWGKMFTKYPLSYLEAIYGMAHGYVYPNYDTNIYQDYNYLKVVYTMNEVYGLDYDPDLYFYSYDRAFAQAERASKINGYLEFLRRLPPFSLNTTTPLVFDFLFLLWLYGKYKNNRIMSVVSLMPFGIFLGCIFSPNTGNMRYAFPAIIIFPFVMAISISMKKNKNGVY